METRYRYDDGATYTDNLTLAEAQEFRRMQNGGTISPMPETKVKAQMTPGPWDLDIITDICVESADLSENGKPGVAEANATVIAALPELIDRLRISNDNLALAHTDHVEFDGHGSLYTCECGIAQNWRNNEAALRKAGVL